MRKFALAVLIPFGALSAYALYDVGFVGIFVFLFSALGNFGILTRQRTMMTPLLLVLIALPTAYERVRARRVGRAT